jgi:enolase
LLNNGLDTDVGTEGGYAPNIDNSMQALDLIVEAIKEAGYEPGQQIQLGMDVGASVLYDHDRKLYHFGLLDHDLTAAQLISLYNDWSHKYPFVFIEDGLYEDDWNNWRAFTKEFKQLSKDYTERNFNQGFMVAGDDIFVTNPERLQSGIDQEVANTVIIKPNQIGTLTDTLEFAALAGRNNYKLVVSHRSGETNDDFISDLSVGLGAEYIKAGSLARGERVAKYNRLLEIENSLNKPKSK